VGTTKSKEKTEGSTSKITPSKNELEVSWVKPSSIKRYENNPRKNEEAVSKVKESIKTFGWQQPIVVDKNMVIIAGDTRYQAAVSLGLETVPVHIASSLTDDEVRAYRIADNKVAEVSEWDDTKLLVELSSLMEAQFDMSGFGFSSADIQALGSVKKDTRWLEDFDTLPPPKPKWILISAPEDECSAILSTLGELGLENMKFEYSGDKA